MELTLPTLGQIITGLGTVIGIAAITFARDWRDGKSLFKRNGTAESVKILKEMLDLQRGLKEHYNDDTTRVLMEIRDGMREHNKLEERVHESVRGMATKLSEFDRFGVKTRP